ncbi:MAG: RNA 2',3'-cyclic phosphodiesterase [Candidatus Methanomethylophilaceae archaeon]|nr:RNA 2',3'-cyclic phosphodiesterase [Candidatus Methanomethylophilaceae archaeon]
MIRTFISIPVPDRHSLDPIIRDITVRDNIRPSPGNQLHITLRFVGDIHENKADKLIRCVTEACSNHHPIDVVLKGAGCFPNAKRPSVIWVGASPGDELTSLSDSISKALSSAGFDFDDKPFKSHVTVGRCKGPAKVDDILGKYSDTVFCNFRCDEVLVMKSVLGPRGATHSVLGRVPLC